ncbi:MAG: cryptochrome/photolyase family protein, partial [Planctomycetaceae bacterium]|nr:cryptochrome/photolyase family protein [Planctomycetaceae bacterium]
MRAALIYPHQLYQHHPAVEETEVCLLVEDPLFFRHYPFHSQKLVLHRASMREYADKLRGQGHDVVHVEFEQLEATGEIVEILSDKGIDSVRFVQPCDDWLEQRLTKALEEKGLSFKQLEDPAFLTPWEVFDEFAEDRKSWFFHVFYKMQRKRLGLLLDQEGEPLGGQWSFDEENRKKLPKGMTLPDVRWPQPTDHVQQAIDAIEDAFPNAPGEAGAFHYPVTHKQAHAGLQDFLDHRFEQFGAYEDAIDRNASFLFHSVLTPALNIGLLTPQEVVNAAMERQDDVPLTSLEGFIRQVIGWREYMRGVYRQFGRRQRTRNLWGHRNPLPGAFYTGETGIAPVDTVIKRVLKHAYCHHIERLMILGNFMLLTECDPDDVYQWFMELFIDAYDWVMVPNVYGMSQYADGGVITTKPYISGSNYVRKMSNFPKGDWCDIWDGLYWRFIHTHREVISENARMGLIVSQCDRMGDKLDQHIRIAEEYLE